MKRTPGIFESVTEFVVVLFCLAVVLLWLGFSLYALAVFAGYLWK